MNDSRIHVPPALYIWHMDQLSGSGKIIDHVNLELLLLYIHVLGYVKGTLRGGGRGIGQLNV